MGEKQNQSFQPSFNASLKIDFQGSRVTSDGGLIQVRELDERLGFGELIEQHLTDARNREIIAGYLQRARAQATISYIPGDAAVASADKAAKPEVPTLE